jgi:hypothetical protein
MKKGFGFIVILSFIFFACSPESVLNKKLNGEWELESINGQNVGDSIAQILIFSKDKRSDGSVSELASKNSVTYTNTGIYYIFKSQTLTMAFSDDPNIDTRVFSVIESSKSELTLTQEGKGNAKFVYKKK